MAVKSNFSVNNATFSQTIHLPECAVEVRGHFYLKPKRNFPLTYCSYSAWLRKARIGLAVSLFWDIFLEFQYQFYKGSSSLSDSAYLRLGHIIILLVKIQQDHKWQHLQYRIGAHFLISSKHLFITVICPFLEHLQWNGHHVTCWGIPVWAGQGSGSQTT